MNDQRSYAGLISAIVGLVALLAKAHPAWSLVQTLASDVPNFTAILGYVVPGLALVVTSITHPAHWLRDPIVTAWTRARAFVASFVPKSAP